MWVGGEGRCTARRAFFRSRSPGRPLPPGEREHFNAEKSRSYAEKRREKQEQQKQPKQPKQEKKQDTSKVKNKENERKKKEEKKEKK